MNMKLNFLDKLGAVGAFLAAASCPACFPILGVVGASLGLGFLHPYEGILMYVFQGLIFIALIGNILAFRKHRRVVPLLIGIASPGIIFWAFYIHFNDAFIYMGLFGLVLASVLNYMAERSCKACLPQPKKAMLISVIQCPKCGFKKEETMPTDSCQFFYQCHQCGVRLKPKEGDCCVFCSYGSIKCPSKQEEKDCC